MPVSVTYTILISSNVILVGLSNNAAVPWPSAKPLVLPLVEPPANTVTVGVAPEIPAIFLIQLLPLSTTNRFIYVESNAIPDGFESPIIARVVTTPSGVIFLIALFPESATYIFLSPSIARALGFLNLAPVPVPSWLTAVPVPAIPQPANTLT